LVKRPTDLPRRFCNASGDVMRIITQMVSPTASTAHELPISLQ
jgi:hypothetical protein